MAGEVNKGWISLYRSIQDHWLWQEKPYDKAHAWLDLLLSANHQDKKIVFDSNLVDVKRGEFITSIRKLCERWGWSNSKVKKFLETLQLDGMITYKSDTKKTTINIVNYNVYQPSSDAENVTEAFQRDTPGEDSGVNGSSGFGLKNGLKNALTTFEKNMEKSDGSKLGVSMDSGKQGITETSQKHHRNDTETSQKHTNNNDNNDNNDNKEEDKSFLPETFELNNYFETITKRIGVIASQLPELNELVKIYPYDWIKEAMEIAVEKNARTVRYISKILQNWTVEGKTEKKKQEETPNGWGHLKKFT